MNIKRIKLILNQPYINRDDIKVIIDFINDDNNEDSFLYHKDAILKFLLKHIQNHYYINERALKMFLNTTDLIIMAECLKRSLSKKRYNPLNVIAIYSTFINSNKFIDIEDLISESDKHIINTILKSDINYIGFYFNEMLDNNIFLNVKKNVDMLNNIKRMRNPLSKRNISTFRKFIKNTGGDLILLISLRSRFKLKLFMEIVDVLKIETHNIEMLSSFDIDNLIRYIDNKL